MAPQTRYAKSGDVRIAYQVVGDGPIDLVFVPGFVSHVELVWEEPHFARFLERLASFSRLILFDRRGLGLSDRPGGPPTLEESTDDLRAVLDAVGSERPAIMGNSEGGVLAMLFAATFPERTRALVLHGAYARLVDEDGYDEGIPEEVLDEFLELVEEDWGGPVALVFFGPTRVHDPRFADWWARYLRQGASPGDAARLLGMYRAIDVRLVLHRSDDAPIPVDLGRYIAERIPDARFVELDGADHLPFLGDADALLDEVEEFLTGARSEREVDRMLATVMFTDIVGSTERAAALGDREWRDLVESHDSLVRGQLDRFHGRPIKTMGDGFLATFDGPARAIRCASSIADEVGRLGIEIRAGLHTGECEVMGDDLGGMAVNIGARVASKAGPGEVLVSGTVRDLVVGSDIHFADRGTHELKGVPGEWRLYAVA
jgi:class 3 adenylate cyclase